MAPTEKVVKPSVRDRNQRGKGLRETGDIPVHGGTHRRDGLAGELWQE